MVSSPALIAAWRRVSSLVPLFVELLVTQLYLTVDRVPILLFNLVGTPWGSLFPFPFLLALAKVGSEYVVGLQPTYAKTLRSSSMPERSADIHRQSQGV